MFLLDTNVWLELLLGQQKAGEVQEFLSAWPASELAITEFSLYSIGIILTRLKKDAAFENFLADILEDGGVRLVRLDPAGLRAILAVRGRFGLDFDDAYQYVAAERHDLTLISFDGDFDRTERGRKTPADVGGAEP
jgi:hypothetical protein